MKLLNFTILGILLFTFSCTKKDVKEIETKTELALENNETNKIAVLNFGTFHLAGTSDAYKIEYDTEDKKNQSETYQIAKMIAQFKPTVICVERVPSENNNMNNDYQKYLADDLHEPNYPGEIGLIAYPVGKIAKVKKIYCIDEQETADYNYSIYSELKNQVDSITVKNYFNSIIGSLNDHNNLSTKEKLKMFNSKEYYDLCINLNADILTHTATKGNFEGADEAAKFYRRNLRIYSNLNQIPLKENDRVFILLGATHTAFLNEFIKRSPKYKLENPLDYLK